TLGIPADLFNASGRHASSAAHQYGEKYGAGMVRIRQTVILQGGSAMTLLHIKNVGFALLFLSTLLATACHHPPKTPPPPPPLSGTGDSARPTPSTPAPTITLRAEPATIERGG